MGARTFNWQQVKEMAKAASFLPFTFIWIFHGIGAFGITFVLPTVIYELGISDTAISQVMTMVCPTHSFRLKAALLTPKQPPSTLNFFLLIGVAYLIHTKRLNAWVAGLAMETTQIICYILLITVTNPRARYIFVMIALRDLKVSIPSSGLVRTLTVFIFPMLTHVAERIRAVKGTTSAALAIGITNVRASTRPLQL